MGLIESVKTSDQGDIIVVGANKDAPPLLTGPPISAFPVEELGDLFEKLRLTIKEHKKGLISIQNGLSSLLLILLPD